jgi:hypothetical protein
MTARVPACIDQPTTACRQTHRNVPFRAAATIAGTVFAILALALPATACPNLPGDLDGDAAVITADLQTLAGCWSAPNVPNPNCPIADLDGDADVDLFDFATMQQNETAPACSGLQVPYLNITYDGGLSFVPHVGPPPTSYFLTWSIAAANDHGLIYLHSDNKLWYSLDDGCAWTALPDPVVGRYCLTVGPGGVVYAWPDNGNATNIYCVYPATADKLSSQSGLAPADLCGFTVDPGNADHVRACGNDGQLYDSKDRGASWSPVGMRASTGSSVLGYFAAFDPTNPDHVIYGQASSGGAVTLDGGQSWSPCAGLAPDTRANFFKAVFSPVDPNIVYGMAINLVENLAGDPSEGRHIYVSTDGGQSFTPVLSAYSEGVELQNGPVMAADPRDANVFYFLRSVKPLWGGTNFYTYNRLTDTVTFINNSTIPTVRSMEFSPRHPCELLIGFEFVP